MAQNQIKKTPLPKLGYGFIPAEFLNEGEDEYVYRNLQNRSGISYRKLTAFEIEMLVRNNNTSDDWNKIFVSDAFNPSLVKNCQFYGLVRIGKLEPFFLSFSDLHVPVGLYNSTIISCDFGDNVCIDHVNIISHYIIGNESIIINVNELVTTNKAKFGVGIIKEGESENVRIWLEVCNENGARSIMPFNGMLAGDAYMWSKYRDDEALLKKFKEFTEAEFKNKRGFYGKIGDRTVIKNSRIIKDVRIGDDAYIKGANKLKNLTINSGEEGKTQIGEGVELVNGIIGFGCRIFYGVKAVRFVMASHSQLKYGARLINSYLGNNATISCCEVLNSLIFPAHEQHHNNSFLCAALVMGQSNIAAGATIGSNHNSRSPDGELVAGRGFWPGLCVSLKHNSKFASFTILAKGDYPAELHIPIPFSLVANDVAFNQLTIIPGYWFMHNLYALARNSWKYIDRDKRIDKIQHIEYDYLAPDTINEMFTALHLLEKFTGKAYFKHHQQAENAGNEANCIAKGKQLLADKNKLINELTVLAEGFENSKRPVVIVKVQQAYDIFQSLISFYTAKELLKSLEEFDSNLWAAFQASLPELSDNLTEWINIGGQIIEKNTVNQFKTDVKNGQYQNWDDVHEWYIEQGKAYEQERTYNAFTAYNKLTGINIKKCSFNEALAILDNGITTFQMIKEGIYRSRAKDYQNPFRKMVYETEAEMEKVVGKLSENSFILQQEKEFTLFKERVTAIKTSWQ